MEVGEFFVAAYFNEIGGCDFVDYNVPLPGFLATSRRDPHSELRGSSMWPRQWHEPRARPAERSDRTPRHRWRKRAGLRVSLM